MFSLKAFLFCSLAWGVMGKTLTLEERDAALWTNNSACNTDVVRVKVTFSKDDIRDLRERLLDIRDVTPPLEDSNFDYGFNTNYLASWRLYWATKYDFRAGQNYINQYPHYRTVIQNLGIHFVRVQPEENCNCKVLPLLIITGFPGSILEVYEAIPELTRCRNGIAFDVIVPFLPGLGYSDAATITGFGSVEVATVMKNLMKRLGFDKFYLQAGDCTQVGAMIATLYPEATLGFHASYLVSYNPLSWGMYLAGAIAPSLVANSEIESRMYPVTDTMADLMTELGYLHIMATKPDTIGLVMSESPSGLMAFLLQIAGWLSRSESVHQPDGALDELFDRDRVLDSISVYWFSNCMTSAGRLYAETFATRTIEDGTYALPTNTPTWIVVAKNAAITQSEVQFGVKFQNILKTEYLDDYGHFLAYEAPDVYVDSVFEAVGAMEAWHARNFYAKYEL